MRNEYLTIFAWHLTNNLEFCRHIVLFYEAYDIYTEQVRREDQLFISYLSVFSFRQSIFFLYQAINNNPKNVYNESLVFTAMYIEQDKNLSIRVSRSV